MKIRIRGNSIRYRLTKTEVETFCRTGYFSERTEFSTNVLLYDLKAKAGIEYLDADFKDNTITLFVPIEKTETWATNSKVGFENTITLNSGKTLALLIEKDFVCMDEKDEDQSDNYPNPAVK